ncbi:carboxypeptidase-like regulatory domain-containing protein [Pontibacter harenae]|uniref:carboxypeptidase-like regulatory domain-containing protein n=1 Tax=Pontibacter harenae TaxID=2894083 RepID=UPI001E5837F2|nr:carboxypeptidase-like regulatory domain-containing protein [Pontibacter harenae]MCC9165523.1 carboxypeptidase-like regulatory domain-containing protein [Pontibacter harenae]
MADKIRIKINKPCGESWSGMEPTQEGRYCSACSKEVVDFTDYTDKQLLEFMREYSGRLCGRLREDQLKQYPLQLSASPLKLSAVKAFFATAAALVVPAVATAVSTPTLQQPVNVLQKDSTSIVSKDATHAAADSLVTIQGKVVHNATKEPLPGVSVTVKGTTKGALTDKDGYFWLSINKTDNLTLDTSYIGFERTEVPIDLNEQTVVNLGDILLKEDSNVLSGEVVIVHSNPVNRYGGE